MTPIAPERLQVIDSCLERERNADYVDFFAMAKELRAALAASEQSVEVWKKLTVASERREVALAARVAALEELSAEAIDQVGIREAKIRNLEDELHGAEAENAELVKRVKELEADPPTHAACLRIAEHNAALAARVAILELEKADMTQSIIEGRAEATRYKAALEVTALELRNRDRKLPDAKAMILRIEAALREARDA